MKKKLLVLLPLLFVSLSACVMYNGKGKPGTSKASQQSATAPSGDPSSGEPAVQEGTVYLVFGENGKYKGHLVDTNIESMFLEHAMEFKGNVGDPLPTSEDVTSRVGGSKFVGWTAYNNDGSLTTYTTIPNEPNKILYASFNGGHETNGNQNQGTSGGGGGGSTIIPPTYTPATEVASEAEYPTSGYGFKFSDNSYMQGIHTDDFDGYSQYLISNRCFKQGQIFQLIDFGNKATWAIALDPYSFGGKSNSDTTWQSYIEFKDNQYKVLKDFNCDAVYIKLKMNSDNVYFQLGA